MKTTPIEPSEAFLVDLAAEAVLPVQVISRDGVFATCVRPYAGLTRQYLCAANSLAPTKADALLLLAERVEMASRARVQAAEAALASAKVDEERVRGVVARLRTEASAAIADPRRNVPVKAAA